MLEKDLLYEQICRLNDRTQKRVDTHKDTALNVAQQVLLLVPTMLGSLRTPIATCPHYVGLSTYSYCYLSPLCWALYVLLLHRSLSIKLVSKTLHIK